MPTKHTSDKDVEKAREKVDKLRAQRDAAAAELAETEAGRNNDVRKDKLDAQAAALEAEIAALKNRVKVSKESTDDIVPSEPEVVDTTPTVEVEPPKER